MQEERDLSAIKPVETLTYNSSEYYRRLFDPHYASLVEAAEESALHQGREQLAKLHQLSFSSSTEALKISAIFSDANRVNFSDYDGTRARLDDLGKERNAAVDATTSELLQFEEQVGIETVKVSGRPLVWPDIGLLQQIDLLPPIAIGEAGSALAIHGAVSSAYQDFIEERTGYSKEDLRIEIDECFRTQDQAPQSALLSYRVQPQSELTLKLAYDVQFVPECDGDRAIRELQESLQAKVGNRARIIQSHFIEARTAGVGNTYRIDIVPGDKADATDYVANMLYEAGQRVPFLTAGDSGNDISLVTAALNTERLSPEALLKQILTPTEAVTSNVFISVGNAHPDLRSKVKSEGVSASALYNRNDLSGVYLLADDRGMVSKVLLDDAEMKSFRADLPEDRHGPESILNAYAFLKC